MRRRLLLTSSLGSVLVTGMIVPGVANETKTYTYDALGRLVAVQSAGTVNNGDANSLCYDPAGNRTLYKSSDSGVLASCSAPTPSPTPTPTPNQSPVAVADDTSLDCFASTSVNVLANDSDPDGNLPLAIVSVVKTNSGNAFASVGSGVILVTGGGSSQLTTFKYTMRDALGATATANLIVYTEGDSCV